MEHEKDTDKQKETKKLKNAYKQGIDCYKNNNIEEAKKYLVNAIRPVLSKSLMKSIYVDLEDVLDQTLDAMYHLGLIYQQDKESSDNYSKAAAIFQYCYGFAFKYQDQFDSDVEPEQYLKAAFLAEKLFLESIGKDTNPIDDEYYQQVVKNTKNYKSELTGFREITKGKLASIADWKVDRIAERAQIIEDIYIDSVKFFIDHDSNSQPSGLIQRLIADSINQLGETPKDCEYAIVGLGSLALGTMTPWSDLEFAILIGEDKPEYKEYFKNLTKLLHIKIINFGETPLRSNGIELFNNFKTANKSDEWFWDDVLESGFSFDGPDWHACKTPLGRKGYKVLIKSQDETGIEIEHIIEKQDYELILTPEQMIKFQSEAPAASQKAIQPKESKLEEAETPLEQSWFESDKHLVQSLRSVCLISGSQELLDQYREFRQTESSEEISKTRSLEILKKDVDKFQIKLGSEEEGKLLDVKKDIYRLGDRVVTALADYYDITCEADKPSMSIWQKIDALQEEEHLSFEGAQHLKEALSIAAELRMNTYANNKSQGEGMSSYIPAVGHLDEEQRKKLVEKTFHIKDTSILHYFYYVMIEVQKIIKAFCSEEYHDRAEVHIKNAQLFDNNNHTKGMVHARFLEYDKALKHVQASRNANPKDLNILRELLFLCDRTSAIDTAIEIAELMFNLRKEQHSNDLNHPDIVISYISLGNVYKAKGDYNKTITFYKKALDIQLEVYENPQNNLDIAISYNNLGSAFKSIGDYNQAIEYHEKALKIKCVVYGSISTQHSSVAMSYNNLGNAYKSKGNYNKAIELFNQALGIQLEVFKSNPNHFDLALSYKNLGSVYEFKGEHDQAIILYKKSLEIRLVACGGILNHPDLADSYNDLANAYKSKGYYNKTIIFYKKSLDIQLEVYESTPNHSSIASIYNNLGTLYKLISEYDKAMEYHKKALDIRLIAYETNQNHPYIASSYNNLGTIYSCKNEYGKAIELFNKALDIRLIAYETSLNHPDLAESYNNLGTAHESQGEYDKAIEYLSKALNIRLVAYETSLNHPDIASSYSNLANVYKSKGDYNKAIEYHKKALDIRFIAYETNQNHPDIAISYNNLASVHGYIGEYDKTIELLNKALNIQCVVYETSPNHPDIAINHNNLANAYVFKGEFNIALEHAQTSLDIFSHSSHPKYILMAKRVLQKILLQLGNLALIKNNEFEAREYFFRIHEQLRDIDFNSECFIGFQLQQLEEAYKSNALQSTVNCQLVLIRVDPELQYGNHYHNLACFYASLGNIIKANAAFINALTHPKAQAADELHTAYAQFLILNKECIIVDDMQLVSRHLYTAINSSTMGELKYGKIEQDSVCAILQELIQQQSKEIIINSKVLAYYLLITNPEYIAPEDSQESLLAAFCSYCEKLDNATSFKLLADSYVKTRCVERLREKELEEITVFSEESEVVSVGNTDEHNADELGAIL